MKQYLDIIIKLMGCALIPVVLSAAVYLMKRKTAFSKLPVLWQQLIIGILFGLAAVAGTEFGVDVGGATVNARDAAPLCAGLLFGPPAGIIAGLIGGVERWFATAWGAGEYSKVACSIATAFAGLYAGMLRQYVFDKKRPALPMAFVTGGVMEVVHMTILFFTHLTDSVKAFEIVKICTIPMVFCNALSVVLAVAAVNLLSNGIRKDRSRNKYLTQLFQTPMLNAVVLAFLISTAFVYFLQTYSAEESAKIQMTLSIDDVEREIRAASDRHLLDITRSITRDYEADEDADLCRLASKYGVADIWVIDENGIVAEATDGNTGYDMSSDSDLPEEERQSSRFLVLLGETDEYVQQYMPLAADHSVWRKLAGVSLSEGGFLQIGIDAAEFQDDLASQVKDITVNRRIGEGGHIILADENMNIVSSYENADDDELAAVLAKASDYAGTGEMFAVEVGGEKYKGTAVSSEGYYLFSIMPENEIYESRNNSAYINSYVEIIIYAILFIQINIIIRRVVVSKLHNINDSLAEIIGGKLDTTVNVKDSYEFEQLSGDINSTVGTLKKYIDEAAGRLDKELALASSIQHAILPSVFPPYPDRTEFSIYASMNTAKEVGGDFYDFYLLDENRIAVLIADVSGKGIPAAMFMMTAKTMIKSLIETGIPVEEVFTRANEKLCENNEADMFVTAWMGVINLSTGHVDFANAGHNPPLIYRKDEGFSYLKAKAGFVLAGMDGVRYRKQEFDLRPGDRLFLYTDGVTEAENSADELYGEDRLRGFLDGNAVLGAEELLKAVKSDLDAFAGDREQFDDITMLAFDYFGGKEEKKMEYRVYPALDSSLEEALNFISDGLEEAGAGPKTVMQVSVAFEELFVNVAHYAYEGRTGEISVGFNTEGEFALIELQDSGIPFNPLTKLDPDITLPAEERQIGGLGIFMAKKIMDDIRYEYANGQNTVRMKKKIV